MGRHQKQTAAVVLANIAQTGTELIRQTGVAAAQYPNHDRVPRDVLIAVIQNCTALHSSLFEYVASIEQRLEADSKAPGT